MLSVLNDKQVNINYIYSFVIRDGKAPVMVFSADDNAEEVLSGAGLKILREDEL